MPGFSFQSYERVPGVGDEDYNHNDPLQRAAATEQRTRDYFVRLLPTSYIIHNNLVRSKRQGHAHSAWLRAQSLTASLLSPGQVTVEVAKIAREKLRVNSAPENALVSLDAIPAAATYRSAGARLRMAVTQHLSLWLRPRRYCVP